MDEFSHSLFAVRSQLEWLGESMARACFENDDASMVPTTNELLAWLSTSGPSDTELAYLFGVLSTLRIECPDLLDVKLGALVATVHKVKKPVTPLS